MSWLKLGIKSSRMWQLLTQFPSLVAVTNVMTSWSFPVVYCVWLVSVWVILTLELAGLRRRKSSACTFWRRTRARSCRASPSAWNSAPLRPISAIWSESIPPSLRYKGLPFLSEKIVFFVSWHVDVSETVCYLYLGRWWYLLLNQFIVLLK